MFLDSWMHEECIKSPEVSSNDAFYCENCEDWFSKRAFLEEICNICPKSEYQTPRKPSPSPLMADFDPKIEGPPLEIKREPLQSHEKPSLLAISDPDLGLAEGLLQRLPVQGSKLTVNDLVQLMFFLDYIISEALERWESLERKQVLGLVQVLATAPFKSSSLLERVLAKWLTEQFMDREILAKTLTKPLSIYGDGSNLIEYSLRVRPQ